VDDEVAELAALRRRAYGPGADIDGDPAALARLDELETRVRLGIAPSGPDVEPEPAVVPDAVAASTGAAAVIVNEPDSPAPRFGRRTVLVAGTVVAAVVVVAVAVGRATSAPVSGATPEPAPGAIRVADTSETTLVDIPLDRSLARYVPQPAAPKFPVEGALRWAESIGPYYGWTLWLARSSANGQRCILLDRGDRTYARCSSEERFLGGLLDVSVPYGDVATEYRPARMRSGQSLVVRWTPERGVSILLDEADITYFGDDD
jgi:hypothetical protein